MVYFKPAGARGQALHQDQRYLRVENGTCIAAWLALDDCDPENGCMSVVPGTQNLPMICPVKSDTSVSFTTETVELPESYVPTPVLMKAGDVLFFNGSLVHGSGPNVSEGRFRRSLIAHYAVAEATAIASFYHPVLRMDGTVVELEVNPYGGPCGVFENGELQMHGSIEEAVAAH
jgi:ectoine hydroxylase-related dioxygenase (phytanoyl-CoA dioxygenase family)